MNIEELPCPKAGAKLGLIYSFAQKTLSASLWAPKASKVELRLYKNVLQNTSEQLKTSINTANNSVKIEENLQNAEYFSVQLKFSAKTGVWQKNWNEARLLNDFKTADLSGWFYEYLVTNNQNGETITRNCLDPYAFSMAEYRNDGKNCPGAIIDFEDSRFLVPVAEWRTIQQAKQSAPNRSKVIIYEVSVRDFTVSPDAGTKEIPGTYLAFIEKIPYLKKLGVTHVQLMPVLNFYNNDESKKDFSQNHENCNYNWGYDPHNYFSPEGWLAANSRNPYRRIMELQQLVSALHNAGLHVILDVVYNHMATTSFLEDIVPGYYFRQNDDGAFIGNSGCGNDTASERPMVKKLIIDSMVHWVKNYDVDGFRFDLMGLMESSVILDGLKACRKIKKDILFIGEGWKMYSGKTGVGLDQNYMQQTDDVAVFNDEFRDLIKGGGMNEYVKGFATGASVDLMQLFYNHTGRPQKNYTVCHPANNVQYIAAHDGLTLHDNICVNCGLNENDPVQCSELYRRIKLANFLLLTSQGIAFIHSGQERGRTKLAVSPNSKNIAQFCFDSYNTADSVNAFSWQFSQNQQNLFHYMCSLIEFRKSADIFCLNSLEKIEQRTRPIESLWKEQLLVYAIKDKGKNWYVIANGSQNSEQIPLALKKPQVFADTNGACLSPIAAPSGITIDKNGITVEPLSAFILTGKV